MRAGTPIEAQTAPRYPQGMGLIVYLIITAVGGLIVGGLSRLLLPGPDPMSLWATMGVGLLASFISGLIWWALIGYGGGSFVLSLVIGVGIVYLIRRERGRSLHRPRGF